MMGVLLHAHYRLMGPGGQKIVMPAPVDKETPNAPWWWDHVASQAADFRRAGFTAVLLPPMCKTASGAASDADGYGLYDNYDIGSKNQVFNVPTRFGDRERLLRCIAILHACGMDVYADVVMHQYDGGNNGTYKYLAADGKTLNGRFPKHPSCFVGAPPRVAVDPVANPQGNFGFGDMASYMNSTPKGYMLNGAIEAADWLTRTLDIQGYRIDDTKGMAVQAVRKLLESESMANRFAVGEYFDGNASALHWWVWNSGMGGRCNAFDFTLHWVIQAMCNNNSNWWMGALQGAGYIAVDPANAVTFVDNPDTDLSFGENVIWNKMLGYALILTAEGYPSVYYKDYSTDTGCYGLKPLIDNLIWIHENLAFGTTLTRWGNDQQAYVFERQGYPGLLVALNNDQWNTQQRTVQTSFGPNVQLHEYTGKHSDIWTDGQGRATFTIPRNTHGQSYLCFSRIGYGQVFEPNPRPTTQTFFGAQDLDIGPVIDGAPAQVGRIWCQQGTLIQLALTTETDGWGTGTAVTLEIADGNGKVLATGQHTATSGTTRIAAKAPGSGWFALRLGGHGLPKTGASYALTVTYTGTEELAG
jgi:alpha-amylase